MWRILYKILDWVHRALAWLVRAAGSLGNRVCGWLPRAVRTALGMAVLGALAAAAASWTGDWLLERAKTVYGLDGAPLEELRRLTGSGEVRSWSRFGWAAAAGCVLGIVAAFWRNRWAYRVLCLAWGIFAVLCLWAFRLVGEIPSRLFAADSEVFPITTRHEFWLVLCGWTLVGVLAGGVVLVVLARGATRTHYLRRVSDRRGWADRLIESLRSGGEDPRFRSSVYWSLLLCFMVLVFPTLMRGCGWEDPYGLIKGKGEPVVTVVKVKKKKKKKKYVVNAWSPYIFAQPKIDDIKILEELDEETADTYVAQTGKSGLGRGGPGKGGWPEGMENAEVRFIRLKYDGGDWDQNMGQGADYNLLLRFSQFTGFKIASDTEHIEIPRLRRFPKDRAPPFVFLTGKGGISLSSSEASTLRWYCLEEGGCLFIDNGGGTFHSSVASMVRRVFPGKSLRVIASDDPVFQAPFLFPNGAPPLWHHGGSRAMGIRHNGRWVVFYHPGDLNDAWQTGHSGVSKEVAEQAYRIGINVMYYTFNQYYRIHFEE